ncbi:MAG: glycosyltransferase family A protein [Pseudomonadota bacterium]
MIDKGNEQLTATVILPTHGDRAAVLDYSIPSILRQTVKDLELIVIGDGVSEETRACLHGYVAADSRVEFVDKPKHKRRGEPYRHEVLKRARGRIVCYLCDRDMMLEDHVEHMAKLLERHDFAHSARVSVRKEDQFRVLRYLDLSEPDDAKVLKRARIRGAGIPLSFAAHTLDAYHRLTTGWHTTPIGYLTDGAMWWKFLRNSKCRAISDNEYLTIIYLPRYPKAAWPTQRRAGEMKRWHERMKGPGWRADLERQLEVLRQVHRKSRSQKPVPRPVTRFVDDLELTRLYWRRKHLHYIRPYSSKLFGRYFDRYWRRYVEKFIRPVISKLKR